MDDSQGQIDEESIPDEEASQQAVVPFMGDELAAAMTGTGDIYVTLNGICEAIGLSPRPQLRRILRTKVLQKGVRRIPIKTAGGIQRVNCLRIDKVALWIAGTEPSRIKPAFREKIEAYQEELAPIATRVFMRIMGIQPTMPTGMVDPRLAALIQQYDELAGLVLDLRDHVVALAGQQSSHFEVMQGQLDYAVKLLESLTQRQDETEHTVEKLEAKTASLTPSQLAKVREAIEIIARDSAGKPNAMDFAAIYRALYRRFAVNSYKMIPEKRFDEVIRYLRELWRHATDSAPEQGELF